MAFTLQQLKSRLQAISKSDYRWTQLVEPLSSFKKAAVLIPISFEPRTSGNHNEHISIWLTKRSDKMRFDKGQVSFAGGMKDEKDADAIAVALREANEEIGLCMNQVEPLGELPPISNMRGVIITPILALVDPHFVPLPNEEVEYAFRLPLKRFLSKSGHSSQKFDGIITPFFLHNFNDCIMPCNYFKAQLNNNTNSNLNYVLNADKNNDKISNDLELNNEDSNSIKISNKKSIDFLENISQHFEKISNDLSSKTNITADITNLHQNVTKKHQDISISKDSESINNNITENSENNDENILVDTFGLTASLCIEVASGVFLKKPEFQRFADEVEESEYEPSSPWLHRLNWINQIVAKYNSNSKL